MQLFTDTSKIAKELSTKGTIGFVPTMGYLHEGHMSLLKLAKLYSSVSVVSIFVNPLQFNNPDDLKKYPRDPERDKAILEQAGTDYLFMPAEKGILPEKPLAYRSPFAGNFEGAFRPGHFEGVCTIVHRLFEVIAPDIAVFGEKDFQQLRIIERMVSDLDLKVRIIRAPTVREADGLAMSSRNVRLSPEGRKAALSLSRGLFKAKALFAAGEKEARKLRDAVAKELSSEKLVRPEYVTVINEKSFEEVSDADSSSRILLAANVENVRLIDNMPLG